MKRVLTVFLAIALLLANVSYAYAASLYSKLSTDTSKWSFETSGAVESITKTTNGWNLTAGGNVAVSHYARAKYKLPETSSITTSTFYIKETIILPSTFYSDQKVGFRLMNTDNFGTTLNGVHVGAVGIDEFRTGVYINSDHTIRIVSSHDNHPSKEFYKGSVLPVGEHTLELYGNIATVSPWWFKIDGTVVASGTDRLSPDTVPQNELTITRLVAGIDGAAGQNTSSFSLLLKDFEISDGLATPAQTPTPVPTLLPKMGDVNGDGKVDIIDIGIIIDNYAKVPILNLKSDLNKDGVVDIVDIGIAIDNYGK